MAIGQIARELIGARRKPDADEPQDPDTQDPDAQDPDAQDPDLAPPQPCLRVRRQD